MTECHFRHPDPLVSAAAVKRLFDSPCYSLPDFIPRSRKNLVALLSSVRGIYAHPSTDTKRGRTKRFAREDLLRLDARLRDLLARETRAGPEEVTDNDLAEITPVVEHIALTM
jgi:hypothetical protein